MSRIINGVIDQGSSINKENFQGESKSIYKIEDFTFANKKVQKKRGSGGKGEWSRLIEKRKMVKDREYSMEGVKE